MPELDDMQPEPVVSQPPLPVAAPPAPMPAPATFASAMRLPTTTALPQTPNPLDQASEAVAAALQFQARRGYQRDLAAGAEPSAVLVKWAPTLFATPQSGSVTAIPRGTSGAPLPPQRPDVQWVNAAQPPVPPPAAFVPPKPEAPLIMGGVAYRRLPTGDLQEIPGQRQRVTPKASTDQFALAKFKQIEGDIKAANKEFYDRESPNYQSHAQLLKIRNLEDQADKLLPQSGKPLAPKDFTGTSAPAKTSRVRVRNKKGQVGTVPESRIKEYLDAGYTRAE